MPARSRGARTAGILAGVTLAAALGLDVAARPPAAPAGGVVALQRIDVTGLPEVEVYFTVVDDRGDSVLGLTAAELVVSLDGVPQQILGVRSALAGGEHLAVALLFDRSGSMKTGFEPAREAALDFLGRLSDRDQVAVVGFDETIAVQQALTADLAAARGALAALERGRDTALYDAILAGVDQLRSAGTDRRAIVVLSDGRDTRSRASLEDALVGARDAGVAIYALGLPVESDQDALARMSSDTGGSYRQASAPGEIRSLYQSIAEQLANQYLLVFRAAPGADERWHDMRVAYAPAAGEPWSTERGFVASVGPGVSRDRLRTMERQVARRGLPRAAALGGAAGLVASVLLLLLLRAVGSVASPASPLALALIVTTTLLGAAIGSLLALIPGV